jgi:hypothetical protein
MQVDGEERAHFAPGRQPAETHRHGDRERAGSFRFARFANVFGRLFRNLGSFFTTNPKYSIPVAAK